MGRWTDRARDVALPEAAIASLAPYFPRLELTAVEIRQGIPLWVRKGACFKVAAVAINDTVYFAPGQYDPDSPVGLAMIGHELVHIQQQRDAGGLIRFGIPYLAEWLVNWLKCFDGSMAYQAISAETEAHAMEDRIRRDLAGRGVHQAGPVGSTRRIDGEEHPWIGRPAQ